MSADTAMRSVNSSLISPAPRCNSQTSGRMWPWTTKRAASISRWKICDVFKLKNQISRTGKPRRNSWSSCALKCRAIARAEAKNFYYGFLALPQAKRNALCAVYAFMRRADDISDDPGLAASERAQKLDDWLQQALQSFRGEPADDAVLVALADAR